MQRHQEKWGRMVNILDRDGVDKRTAEKFYVAVVQAVFLFGLETCVVTPRLEKSMGTERQLKGKWIYPTIDTELATMGIEEIRVYIARHKNTVFTIHCDSYYHGLVSGGGAESGDVALAEMVGAVRSIYTRDKNITCSI